MSAHPPSSSPPSERQQAYLEQLFDVTPEGLVLLDEHDRVLRVNPEFLAMFGLEQEEIFGRPVNDLIIPPSHVAEAERITRQACAGNRVEVETVRRRRDGSLVDVSLLAAPIRLRDGQIGVAAVYRDITRRIAAERGRERLHQREHLLAKAGAALAETLDYRTTFANVARLVVPTIADYCLIDEMDESGSLRRIALAHADPGRETMLYQDAYHPPDADATLHPTVAVARSGEPVLVDDVTPAGLDRLAHEPEHRTALERLGLRSYMIVPLIARKRTLGTLTLAFAESGRRYWPEDLPLAQELARRAAAAVDNARLYAQAQVAISARERMIAIVSHELRNPLGSILLDATSMLEDAIPPDAVERAERIVAGVERMDRMITDLLDVSRISSGGVPVSLGPVAVDPLVATALGMQRSLAAARGVVLELATPVAGLWVRADRERLLQVFTNLFANALRLTPASGRVEVRVRPGHDEVSFEIADTGPGIPPEHLPHLFDPFWQVPGRGGGGSGLGLAIARGIVEAHRGRIWVESSVGEGTTFYFTVPAVPES